jgi:exodeoxyribonuclease-3
VTLRLLSYNIRHGGIGREGAIADVISACHPDVVLLQEAVHPPTVERLAQRAGMPVNGARAGASVAFLSRQPVRSFAWTRPRWAHRAFLELVLEPAGLRIFGVHLSAVHSNVTERRRVHELRALLTHVRDRADGAHVLTGDFNTLASGESLDLRRLPLRLRAVTWLTGRRIRWKTVHDLEQAGYTDVFRQLHPLDGGYTFPTWDPHLRLDYAFVPSAADGVARSCEVIATATAALASDHFPLLTELEL